MQGNSYLKSGVSKTWDELYYEVKDDEDKTCYFITMDPWNCTVIDVNKKEVLNIKRSNKLLKYKNYKYTIKEGGQKYELERNVPASMLSQSKSARYSFYKLGWIIEDNITSRVDGNSSIIYGANNLVIAEAINIDNHVVVTYDVNYSISDILSAVIIRLMDIPTYSSNGSE